MKLKITLTIYTGLGPSVFTQASLEKKIFLYVFLYKKHFLFGVND
jgi:hypothetical protein